jgi:hypothetical protein
MDQVVSVCDELMIGQVNAFLEPDFLVFTSDFRIWRCCQVDPSTDALYRDTEEVLDLVLSNYVDHTAFETQ